MSRTIFSYNFIVFCYFCIQMQNQVALFHIEFTLKRNGLSIHSIVYNVSLTVTDGTWHRDASGTLRNMSG